MKAVYKLHFDCGRAGTLRGVFIEEIERVEKLIESKETVYFGECMGKHSNIYGSIDRSDVSLVTSVPEEVALVERLEVCNGYNPVERYIEQAEENEERHIFDGKPEEDDE